MKIPESIRIGGIEYDIIEVPNLNDGSKVLYGRIMFGRSQISLNTENQSHEISCVTLWHEILHAITEHTKLELGDDEEKIIDTLAHGVYQVLQDNGRRLFDIAPEEPPTGYSAEKSLASTNNKKTTEKEMEK